MSAGSRRVSVHGAATRPRRSPAATRRSGRAGRSAASVTFPSAFASRRSRDRCRRSTSFATPRDHAGSARPGAADARIRRPACRPSTRRSECSRAFRSGITNVGGIDLLVSARIRPEDRTRTTFAIDPDVRTSSSATARASGCFRNRSSSPGVSVTYIRARPAVDSIRGTSSFVGLDIRVSDLDVEDVRRGASSRARTSSCSASPRGIRPGQLRASRDGRTRTVTPGSASFTGRTPVVTANRSRASTCSPTSRSIFRCSRSSREIGQVSGGTVPTTVQHLLRAAGSIDSRLYGSAGISLELVAT